MSNGMKCKVDECDFDHLNQWRWKFLKASGCDGGYAVRNSYDKETKKHYHILMHRLINQTHANQITDHVNGDKLDNRRSNLRTATASENMHNRGKQKNNKSGVKGIFFDKSRSRWVASLNVEGVTVFRKRYRTKEEASEAYQLAAEEHAPAAMPSSEDPKSWATPKASDPEHAGPNMRCSNGSKPLPAQVTDPKNWPTSRTSDAEGGRIKTEMTEEGFRSHRAKPNQWFGAKLRDAVETYEEEKHETN